jgi:FlaG/FlaF family flagellin (archaellin)
MSHERNRMRGRSASRAVSDMVATLLIVAITVVLAAVLYIAVTSWTTTSGSAPLGSAFAWGSPSNTTATATNGCADTAHYCYTIPMVVTGTDVPVVRITFYLQTPTGVPAAWPTSVTGTGGSLELFGPTSGSMSGRYWPLNSTWQTVPPFDGVIMSGSSLVIYCGGAAEGSHQGLLGLEIVAFGTNGYSGTVASGVFS